MTLKLTNRQTWPWLAALLSGALLLGALLFEHVGGYAPCQMCYWQRHAHKAVLALALLTIIVRTINPNALKLDKLFALLIIAVFLASFALAFWHMGVEYKWWEGPKTCAGGANIGNISSADILSAIQGDTKLAGCSDAPWRLFGLSMAGYNALLSAFGAVFGAFVALKSNKI